MKRLIFISLVIMLLTSCGKGDSLMDEIYNESGYAIGKVNSSITVSIGIQNNYSYNVGSSEYKGNKKEVGLNQPTRVGHRYLVVYKLSDPQKSDINFKYPIKTDQDFWDMLVEFETNPPKR